MSALHVAKKLWIQCFLTVMLICHIFGVFVRIATYIHPYLVFYEFLQDKLEIIFKFFVIFWSVAWSQSLFVKIFQYAFIHVGFNSETEYSCDQCSNPEEFQQTRVNLEWRITCIFRAIQFFFAWVVVGLIIQQIGANVVIDWIEDRLDSYFSSIPNQSLVDLLALQEVTWKEVQDSSNPSTQIDCLICMNDF